MTEQEFMAARWLAMRTKRPDTAFALIVALCCFPNCSQPSLLSSLIGADRTAISEVARQLEDLGALDRTWSIAESERAMEHGRFRYFTLTRNWASVS